MRRTCLAIGAASILLLVVLKRYLPRVPGALTVVVLGTATPSLESFAAP